MMLTIIDKEVKIFSLERKKKINYLKNKKGNIYIKKKTRTKVLIIM